MAEDTVTDGLPDHSGRWQHFLDNCRIAAESAAPLQAIGHLTRINGLVMEASGLKLPLGSSCLIHPQGGAPVEAEVVGFAGERLYLMPSDDVYGLSPGSTVVALDPAPPPAPRWGRPPPRPVPRPDARWPAARRARGGTGLRGGGRRFSCLGCGRAGP